MPSSSEALLKQSRCPLVWGGTNQSSREMLHRLRSYRFLAALLVGTLTLGSSMALVQHACAMSAETSTHAASMHSDDACCCDEMPSHDAPAPMDEPMSEAPVEDVPCHDAPVSATTSEATPHHSSTPCCVIEQPTSTLDDVVLTEGPSTVLLLTAVAAASTIELLPAGIDHLVPTEDAADAVGPPHRLHLLHATFLN